MLNKEIVLDQQKKEMAESHRDAHLVEKTAKDSRWPNMYGDLDPLP